MDEGRFRDLERLQRVLKDPHETIRHKHQATRSMELIKKQLRDPKITRLRERLVRAQSASDAYESGKISDELMAHMLHTYGITR